MMVLDWFVIWISPILQFVSLGFPMEYKVLREFCSKRDESYKLQFES